MVFCQCNEDASNQWNLHLNACVSFTNWSQLHPVPNSSECTDANSLFNCWTVHSRYLHDLGRPLIWLTKALCFGLVFWGRFGIQSVSSAPNPVWNRMATPLLQVVEALPFTNPKHTAWATMQCSCKSIFIFQWPSQSPALNETKNLWQDFIFQVLPIHLTELW